MESFCSRPTVTLLIPTLNEIEAVQIIMPQIKKDWVEQIIVVDGGSTDGTIEYFKSHNYDVQMQLKKGFGEAMKQGLLLSKGDIVVEFTPDGNSMPEAIPALIQKINEGYDLVVASRYKESARSFDDDWLTKFGNWMFTTITNFLFRTHFTDVLVGFRAYKKETALRLGLDAPGLSWPCQSSIRFARTGYRVSEIPVNEPPRIGGKRKMKPFKTGMEIVKTILREYGLLIAYKMKTNKDVS